jgi:hypothetical protein
MLIPSQVTNRPLSRGHPANSSTEQAPYNRRISYPDLPELVDSETGEYPHHAHWALADWQQTNIVTGTHSDLLRSWERPSRTVAYMNGPSNPLRQR